jgi:UDP-N-acetyl-L-fucosamine synthase
VELAVEMFVSGEEAVMAEDYSDMNVSVKVVKLIQSYAKIIDMTVWGK